MPWRPSTTAPWTTSSSPWSPRACRRPWSARARAWRTPAGQPPAPAAEKPATSAPPARGLARLPIPTRQGIVLVDPDTISHAALEDELVTVFTGQGDFLTDFTLNELAEKLPAERFHRVHRRALLNLSHVTRLEPLETGGYLARTARGHSVEVSRQSARELRRMLGLRRGAEDEGA
ncbi:LytTR family DNA-binding domain-containing protein [Pyxidicoccus sp. 3LFB2]